MAHIADNPEPIDGLVSKITKGYSQFKEGHGRAPSKVWCHSSLVADLNGLMRNTSMDLGFQFMPLIVGFDDSLLPYDLRFD